ncbi:MAG: DUF4180 domain-containing protein [Bacteroidia bacterium]
MEIQIIEKTNDKIAVLADKKYKINTPHDAAELLMNCQYMDSNKIIISEKNLPVEFFDLKTKVAGEILQKFSTYNGYLAIIGDFSKFPSKSLREFIYESNKQRRINFVGSEEEAFRVLTK